MDQRLVCGTDVRRTAWTPEDVARAEMLAARYGGTVQIQPVGDAAMAASWSAGDLHLSATGDTATEALRDLARRMAR